MLICLANLIFFDPISYFYQIIWNNLKILKIIADDSMVNESLFNIESLISTVKIIALNNQTKYDPKYKIQKNDSIVFLGENKEIEKLYKSLSF